MSAPKLSQATTPGPQAAADDGAALGRTSRLAELVGDFAAEKREEEEVTRLFAASDREKLARFAIAAHFAARQGARATRLLMESEAELDDERKRVEFFKDLFDRTMSTLERLGGHELPELVQLRSDVKRVLEERSRAAAGRAKGAAAARAVLAKNRAQMPADAKRAKLRVKGIEWMAKHPGRSERELAMYLRVRSVTTLRRIMQGR